MTKQKSKKTGHGPASPPTARTGGSNGKADFPKHTLEEALRVAQVLEDKNSGNPLPPADIAIALGKSSGSSEFRILLSSSIKYGLTTGSYNQPRVSLDELGRDIVQPKSPEAKSRALVQAALKCDLFGKVYEAYKNKRIPDTQFFRNTLVRDFSVAQGHAEK